VGFRAACVHTGEGLEEVEALYTHIAQQVNLAGPTSFAPLIYRAIDIVRESGNSYHILLIIADGQVTNEAQTIKAIVEASKYPLSIIVVGVGDGPWDMMKQFDDKIPQRQFDNFQFVNFEETKKKVCDSDFGDKLPSC
jgi:E3 ubiquitin-protein ligase RGLG